MRDHQTNFIYVRRNHHPHPAVLFASNPGNQAAKRVGADFIRVVFNFFQNCRPYQALLPGRTGGFRQFLDERQQG